MGEIVDHRHAAFDAADLHAAFDDLERVETLPGSFLLEMPHASAAMITARQLRTLNSPIRFVSNSPHEVPSRKR